MKKTLQELNLIDDFLFTEALSDELLGEYMAKLIIRRVTGIEVEHLVIEKQKVVNGLDTDKHGIRMDVAVTQKSGEGDSAEILRFFDIEPNILNTENIPRRSRYYQALDDVKLLQTGTDYDKLPELFTIWILPYDPFKKDYMIYSVKKVLEEFPEIEYNDGIKTIFLYTGGRYGGSQALKNLLAYIENSEKDNAVDTDLKYVHTNIVRLKQNPERGVRYTTMRGWMELEIKQAVNERVNEAVAAAKKEKEEAVNDAVAETKKETEKETFVGMILTFLEEYGEVSEDIRQRIHEQEDIAVLRDWNMLAARAKSVEEFAEKM